MRFKKGILFSLFVITALSLVVLTFKIQSEFKEEDRADVFKRRVERTNMFVEDLEFDIERSLYVSSFRAFVAIDEYMHNEEEFIDNVTKILPELIMNGTLNGRKMNATNASTFLDWTTSMQNIALKYFRLNLSLQNSTVQVSQYSPWLIKVDFTTNVTIDDFDDVIAWNYTLKKETFIDIREAKLPDPLYYIYSIKNYETNVGPLYYTPVVNSIEETHFTEYWTNISGNVSVENLMEHTLNQYYRQSQYGPSYLMRLEGRTNCSEPENVVECQNYGIESMVNIFNRSKMFDYSISPAPTRTCVIDYQFFVEGCDEMRNIINMSGEFFLDDDHLALYDLTKINTT